VKTQYQRAKKQSAIIESEQKRLKEGYILLFKRISFFKKISLFEEICQNTDFLHE
jgi:hypothetical protein